jgi:hypothetical protein
MAVFFVQVAFGHLDPIAFFLANHQPAFQALRCINTGQRTRACKTRQKNRKKTSFPPASVHIRCQWTRRKSNSP